MLLCVFNGNFQVYFDLLFKTRLCERFRVHKNLKFTQKLNSTRNLIQFQHRNFKRSHAKLDLHKTFKIFIPICIVNTKLDIQLKLYVHKKDCVNAKVVVIPKTETPLEGRIGGLSIPYLVRFGLYKSCNLNCENERVSHAASRFI